MWGPVMEVPNFFFFFFFIFQLFFFCFLGSGGVVLVAGKREGEKPPVEGDETKYAPFAIFTPSTYY